MQKPELCYVLSRFSDIRNLAAGLYSTGSEGRLAYVKEHTLNFKFGLILRMPMIQKSISG